MKFSFWPSQPKADFLGKSRTVANENFDYAQLAFGDDAFGNMVLKGYVEAANTILKSKDRFDPFNDASYEMSRAYCIASLTGVRDLSDDDMIAYADKVTGISNYIIRVGTSVLQGDQIHMGASGIEDANGSMYPTLKKAIYGKENVAIKAFAFFKEKQDIIMASDEEFGLRHRLGLSEVRADDVKKQMHVLNEISLQLVRNHSFAAVTGRAIDNNYIKMYQTREFDKIASQFKM